MEIDRSRSLPIAEDFHSLQGEGRWTGTPMHFIRLAGCSVGKQMMMPKGATWDTTSLTIQGELPILKTGNAAWRCHTYDGRPFWCDTDFKLHHWSNFTNLLDDTWENHICLTGGEPFMHEERLHPFIEEAFARQICVHIETSGTIEVVFDPDCMVWVSVSPKLSALDTMIESANEIKLLVDENFDLNKVSHLIRNHEAVYVQPINDELVVNRTNFNLCMEVLRTMPHWHLSVQQHKLLGLR